MRLDGFFFVGMWIPVELHWNKTTNDLTVTADYPRRLREMAAEKGVELAG